MDAVPEQYREPIRLLLTQLVAGAIPGMLMWVRNYGQNGAVLTDQPEDIWSHRFTTVGEGPDGSIWVELPLWTTQESPSDLTAAFCVYADGRTELDDVHVL